MDFFEILIFIWHSVLLVKEIFHWQAFVYASVPYLSPWKKWCEVNFAVKNH